MVIPRLAIPITISHFGIAEQSIAKPTIAQNKHGSSQKCRGLPEGTKKETGHMNLMDHCHGELVFLRIGELAIHWLKCELIISLSHRTLIVFPRHHNLPQSWPLRLVALPLSGRASSPLQVAWKEKRTRAHIRSANFHLHYELRRSVCGSQLRRRPPGVWVEGRRKASSQELASALDDGGDFTHA